MKVFIEDTLQREEVVRVSSYEIFTFHEPGFIVYLIFAVDNLISESLVDFEDDLRWWCLIYFESTVITRRVEQGNKIIKLRHQYDKKVKQPQILLKIAWVEIIAQFNLYTIVVDFKQVVVVSVTKTTEGSLRQLIEELLHMFNIIEYEFSNGIEIEFC